MKRYLPSLFLLCHIMILIDLEPLQVTNLTDHILMIHIKNKQAKSIIASGCIKQNRYLTIPIAGSIPLITEVEAYDAHGKTLPFTKQSSSLCNLQHSDELIFTCIKTQNQESITLTHIKKQL